MYKIGDEILVFDGSNFGNRKAIVVDSGIYDIVDIYEEKTVTIYIREYIGKNFSHSNFNWDLPYTQFCSPENKLIRILYDI